MWLNCVRSIMICLTRAYNEQFYQNSDSTCTVNLDLNGRRVVLNENRYGSSTVQNSFEAYYKSVPSSLVNFSNQTGRHLDAWMRMDIELAFWLGFCASTLARLPMINFLHEVRMFDLETNLINRLCLLPIHLACPHVVNHIRFEAHKLAVSGLTTHQKGICFFFNCLFCLFAHFLSYKINNDESNINICIIL